MARGLIIIGGGGHARSIIEILSVNQSNRLLGYTDIKESNELSKKGINYLGRDDIILDYKSEEVSLILGLSYLGQRVDLGLRKTIILKFSNYEFESVLSKDANIAKDVLIDNGSVIFKGAIINTGTIIGENCVINTGAIIEHDCRIENHVQIGPGSIILGGTKIKKNCYIGAKSVLRDGIVVEENILIGMSSNVISDISKSGLYYGNPAQFIKQ